MLREIKVRETGFTIVSRGFPADSSPLKMAACMRQIRRRIVWPLPLSQASTFTLASIATPRNAAAACRSVRVSRRRSSFEKHFKSSSDTSTCHLKAAPPRTNCDHRPAAEPTEASRNGNLGSECRAAMKRYSIMVKQDGSDHEIEVCQVDSNPKKVAEAAGMRRLRNPPRRRRQAISAEITASKTADAGAGPRWPKPNGRPSRDCLPHRAHTKVEVRQS